MRQPLRKTLLLIALVLICGHQVSAAQEGPSGALTLLVRDSSGQRLGGVSLTVFYDTDLAGRVELGRYTTDARGEVQLDDLAWGTYIIQFRGSAPDGRPIQPPTQQNMGMLDDGSGVANGFGLYFTEPQRVEMYVLGSVRGESNAVPMFDMADTSDAPPEPYDPIVGLANQGPTPTPYTLQQALEAHKTTPAPPEPTSVDRAVLWVIGLGIWLVALLLGYGYWKTRSTRAQDERI
ncbi:MAG: prealbumin-like fold domain-containing protein [Herpetosiphonaceae bacterium]|nr:prealbumin-like fold domain-containing protein [Herpetosiphonaceae bacterium]